MKHVVVEESIRIERPLAEVFAYVSDLSHAVGWDRRVVQSRKLTHGPVARDSRFHLVFRLGVQEIPLQYRVESIDAPHRITFKGRASGLTLTDYVELDGDASHTQLTYRLSLALLSPFGYASRVLAPLLRRHGRRSLGDLKHTLEGAPTRWRATRWTSVSDHLVWPNLLKFSKYGYAEAKEHWSGVHADLRGQRVLITGATSGIGAAAACDLAKLGAQLIIVARNEHVAKKFAASLVENGARSPTLEFADLSSIKEVNALCDRLLAAGEPLHVLINNAGALFNERSVTAEGIERSFATLLLSPFILTERLYPLLKQAGRARVINVSSGGMYTQRVHLGDLEYQRGFYSGSRAYARAKRGLVDLSAHWAERWRVDNIVVNAMHPGWSDTPGVVNALPIFYEIAKPLLRTAEQGADTITWLAASREAATQTGLFWLDRTPHPTEILPRTKTTAAGRDRLVRTLQQYQDRLRAPS